MEMKRMFALSAIAIMCIAGLTVGTIEYNSNNNESNAAYEEYNALIPELNSMCAASQLSVAEKMREADALYLELKEAEALLEEKKHDFSVANDELNGLSGEVIFTDASDMHQRHFIAEAELNDASSRYYDCLAEYDVLLVQLEKAKNIAKAEEMLSNMVTANLELLKLKERIGFDCDHITARGITERISCAGDMEMELAGLMREMAEAISYNADALGAMELKKDIDRSANGMALGGGAFSSSNYDAADAMLEIRYTLEAPLCYAADALRLSSLIYQNYGAYAEAYDCLMKAASTSMRAYYCNEDISLAADVINDMNNAKGIFINQELVLSSSEYAKYIVEAEEFIGSVLGQGLGMGYIYV